MTRKHVTGFAATFYVAAASVAPVCPVRSNHPQICDPNAAMGTLASFGRFSIGRFAGLMSFPRVSRRIPAEERTP